MSKYEITNKEVEAICKHLLDLNVPVQSYQAIQKMLTANLIVERTPEDVPNPVN